jgi:hypothetical protein
VEEWGTGMLIAREVLRLVVALGAAGAVCAALWVLA